jgi:hypothetical protein
LIFAILFYSYLSFSFLLLQGLDSPLQPVCKKLSRVLGSCKPEGPYKICMVEHAFQPVVVTNDAVFYDPGRFQDQAGDVYKCMDKPFKFHTDNGKPQGTVRHQQSIPGFQIPGQGGDNHISPIGG